SVPGTVVVGVPGPARVAASGVCGSVTGFPARRSSDLLTPPSTLGTDAWQFASAKALGVAEQITVGAVLSVTTKLVVQVALLPAASVAVTVIVLLARPTIIPCTGVWTSAIEIFALLLQHTLTPN